MLAPAAAAGQVTVSAASLANVSDNVTFKNTVLFVVDPEAGRLRLRGVVSKLTVIPSIKPLRLR